MFNISKFVNKLKNFPQIRKISSFFSYYKNARLSKYLHKFKKDILLKFSSGVKKCSNFTIFFSQFQKFFVFLFFTYKQRTRTFNHGGALFHDFIETSVTPMSERKHGKHPTQKPEALMLHFVEILSNPNDWVMDPFMGSGTTGVAARKADRNFIGIELNKDYFAMAKARIEEN